MKPWAKQIFAKKERIPTVNEVLEIANSIRDDRNRCLFVLTYLTAGRMQELVRYKSKTEERDSIKPSDIKIKESGGRMVLLIDIRNEKHRSKHRKDIPVPLDIPENKHFVELMNRYITTIEKDEEIFKIGYKRAYAIMNTIVPNWNPHFIRHLRLTHLVTTYGYREHQLRMYAGWSDSRPAKNYLELRWQDLMY